MAYAPFYAGLSGRPSVKCPGVCNGREATRDADFGGAVKLGLCDNIIGEKGWRRGRGRGEVKGEEGGKRGEARGRKGREVKGEEGGGKREGKGERGRM